jgi:hypothetical protein
VCYFYATGAVRISQIAEETLVQKVVSDLEHTHGRNGSVVYCTGPELMTSDFVIEVTS